jgi:hypothetical protein
VPVVVGIALVQALAAMAFLTSLMAGPAMSGLLSGRASAMSSPAS